ncbi:GntR family transcriptional regulator [Candidatus Nephthysia bennettiae]|uniref:FadR/GntR family transcriptional regulator n=1 Tax=Candidatus Nephthysia bennettiae TaxID=3127016 RepID=UPI0030C6F1B7
MTAKPISVRVDGNLRKQLRQPRLAELVAEELRQRITSGALRDGDLLPKLEELLEEFNVSKPSLREALRILETEGLITVRRGNMGGAVVHAPGSRDAGYMIGLVLESRNVTVRDLAEAIKQFEPICAALCAQRPDRMTAVVPSLRRIQERQKKATDDPLAFARIGREFHEVLVERAGNETIKLVMGALEAVWSAGEQVWAERATSTQSMPDGRTRNAGLRAHERVIEMIAKGDSTGVAAAARKHLESAQLYAVADPDEAVKASAVRATKESRA